jgi:hypothetical protein
MEGSGICAVEGFHIGATGTVLSRNDEEKAHNCPLTYVGVVQLLNFL